MFECPCPKRFLGTLGDPPTLKCRKFTFLEAYEIPSKMEIFCDFCCTSWNSLTGVLTPPKMRRFGSNDFLGFISKGGLLGKNQPENFSGGVWAGWTPNLYL